MDCAYFQSGRCRSCTEIETPYAQQLTDKQQRAERALAAESAVLWLPSIASSEAGFRNKAKMMVGGTVSAPTLGILDAGFAGVDLAGCPLYPPGVACSFEPLRRFIKEAGLEPYDVAARRGELKHALVTVSEAPGNPLLLRLVCRTSQPLARIQRSLPDLLRQLPSLQVVSLNLLPEHKAASEGDQEILLTGQTMLPMPLNGLPLYVQPRSFFQTNSEVAAALYRQAQQWAQSLQPASVLDLYCGVGGFALHLALVLPADVPVRGVELSAEAIACARRSADELQLPQIQFDTSDATRLLDPFGDGADLVVVNPPRRGLGDALCQQLDAAPARWMIYSSCNAETLATDLARLPHWHTREARVFDMFPHSRHFEVMVLLERDA